MAGARSDLRIFLPFFHEIKDFVARVIVRVGLDFVFL
jgi:hypothetical protein